MNAKIAMSVGLALAMAGCASIPQPNGALERAQAAVQAADADPNVHQYAAVDLEAARKQLDIAEAAAAHHQDAAIAQPAYMATQTARLAQAHATAKADDARVAAGHAERDKIQLAARTRDVAAANLATNAAIGQRDAAAQQAATATQQAATATQQAATANLATNAAIGQRDAAAQQAATANLATNTAIGQRDAASRHADRLQAEVDQLKATPTPRGLVLTLGDVMFDTGRAQLNPGSGRKLDQVAQFLTSHPERRVQIDGYTDSVGTDSYNQDLSQRRAEAVKSALVARGVDPSRIGTQGYGKGYPVADNTDSGGRQLNRRVEVIIGQDDGASIAARS
ncbi:MAG: OmpA family protein [Steroidobacteraceae bacterium]